jgi:hypothetical protein
MKLKQDPDEIKTIHVRIPLWMWHGLEIEARKNGQTVSAEIRSLVAATLPKRSEEPIKKWYDGMPFRKGGAK